MPDRRRQQMSTWSKTRRDQNDKQADFFWCCSPLKIGTSESAIRKKTSTKTASEQMKGFDRSICSILSEFCLSQTAGLLKRGLTCLSCAGKSTNAVMHRLHGLRWHLATSAFQVSTQHAKGTNTYPLNIRSGDGRHKQAGADVSIYHSVPNLGQ